jgi:DNA invertase Pin-like site-specific DNA recombinase
VAGQFGQRVVQGEQVVRPRLGGGQVVGQVETEPAADPPETMTMPLAVLYARFSPRPNAYECDSVEKQLERCRAYCEGHGYSIDAEYHDKDVSGERADNRPGLQKAIARACDRKAVLCVYSLSRLARCKKDAIDLAERLSAAGADLAVIQENVNTRAPMGRFILTLFSALAQLEREQIAERTSTAMLRHQAKGRRMTRPDRCPYGWRPDACALRHPPRSEGRPSAVGQRPVERPRAARKLRAPVRPGVGHR